MNKSLLLLSAFFSMNTFADTITLKADNWCPYNCDPTSKDPGYMVEIAKIVFEKAGHKIDYKIGSWNKALQEAESGEIVGIIGASSFDLPKGPRPTEPLGQNNECFFVKADSEFTFKNTEQLTGKKIGTVADYTYTDSLNEFFKKNPGTIDPVHGDKPLIMNMRKLTAGRVDVVVENESVFNYTAKTEKLEKDFKNAGCNPPDTLFITFSPKNPKSPEYAKLLNDGLLELRKTGELSKILVKYGLKDWK